MTAGAGGAGTTATGDRTAIAVYEGSTPRVRRRLRAEGLAILACVGRIGKAK